MKIQEYIISLILGLITTIIGVIISIRCEKRKEEKERIKRQNLQWESFNDIMYNVRDWAREIEKLGHSNIRFISSNQMYNKLACNEIPLQYRKDVFDIAVMIDEIKYMITVGTNKEMIKSLAGNLGDLACKYARDKNSQV